MTLDSAQALDLNSGEWSFARIYREGWRIYRANFVAINLSALCVYAPLYAIYGLSQLATRTNGADGLSVLASCLLTPLSFLGRLVQAAIIFITAQAACGKRPTWQEAMAQARRRFGNLWLTSFGAGIVVLALSLLLLVPGIIWSVYYSFYDCVAVLKDRDSKVALDYSKALVKERALVGGCFGFMLLNGAVDWGINLGLPYLGGLLYGTLIGGAPHPFVAAAMLLVVTLLTAPLLVPHTLFFLNLDAVYRPQQSRVTFYNQGVALVKEGKLDEAIAAYTSALEVDPRYAHAYLSRGNAYGRKGNVDMALADYARAIAIDPADAAPWYRRGLLRLRRDNPHEAIADFSRAIELKADDADAFYQRGNAYLHLADTEHAIADYTRAIELDPQSKQAYSNRGVAQRMQGDLPQSIADYDRAIQIDPAYADAWFNRGVAYAQAGDKAQAFADYTRALELKPTAPAQAEIQQKIAELSGAPA